MAKFEHLIMKINGMELFVKKSWDCAPQVPSEGRPMYLSVHSDPISLWQFLSFCLISYFYEQSNGSDKSPSCFSQGSSEGRSRAMRPFSPLKIPLKIFLISKTGFSPILLKIRPFSTAFRIKVVWPNHQKVRFEVQASTSLWWVFDKSRLFKNIFASLYNLPNKGMTSEKTIHINKISSLQKKALKIIFENRIQTNRWEI